MFGGQHEILNLLNQLLKLCKHTVLSLIFKSLTPEKPELEGRTKIPVKLLGVIKNTFFSIWIAAHPGYKPQQKIRYLLSQLQHFVYKVFQFQVCKGVSCVEEGNLGQKIMLDMKLILTEKMRGWQTHSTLNCQMFYCQRWKWIAVLCEQSYKQLTTNKFLGIGSTCFPDCCVWI